MGDLNKFCERMRYWCGQADLGYDQSNRQDFRDGGECDCSSLVIHALQEAGFDTGGATYTGNMSEQLKRRGWQRVNNDGNPQKGDILLNDVNHVAVWLGDCLAQASGDERGSIAGGAGGDQTGWETNLCEYYNYPWNCYLRYTGGEAQPQTQPSTNEVFTYRAFANGQWYEECQNLTDQTGDGFAGDLQSPITAIAIKVNSGSVRYRVHIKGGDWLPYVTGYNINDFVYGYAGDKQSEIDCVEVYWDSSDGNGYAQYAVYTNGWLDWQIDNQTSNGQDGYAGIYGRSITGFKLTAKRY